MFKLSTNIEFINTFSFPIPNAVRATCGKEIAFELPETSAEHTFLSSLYARFRVLVEPHVAGSYVLHRMLDRPTEWTPGDLDVYLTDEIPILFDLVLAWIRRDRPHATITLLNRTKIDVMDGFAMPVSLIFRRASIAVQEFDISVCSVWVPLRTLISDDREFVEMADETVIRDIIQRRMRVHPYVLGTKQPAVGSPVAELDGLKERMEKYKRRGFEPYEETNEQRMDLRLATLHWYTPNLPSASETWNSAALNMFDLEFLQDLGPLVNRVVNEWILSKRAPIEGRKRARSDSESASDSEE